MYIVLLGNVAHLHDRKELCRQLSAVFVQIGLGVEDDIDRSVVIWLEL